MVTGNKGIDTRADVIIKRTYSRPDEDGNYESWEDIVARVIRHQTWLWERAKKSTLSITDIAELNELKQLMAAQDYKNSLSLQLTAKGNVNQ